MINCRKSCVPTFVLSSQLKIYITHVLHICIPHLIPVYMR